MMGTAWPSLCALLRFPGLLVWVLTLRVLGDAAAELPGFMKQSGERAGVVTLPSGLQYEVLRHRANASARLTRACLCHFRGTLANGSDFENTYAQNAPAPCAPERPLAGLAEALRLMRAEDKWRLAIPSKLGYGAAGLDRRVPADSDLILDVEVLRCNATFSLQDALFARDEVFAGWSVAEVGAITTPLVWMLYCMGMLYFRFFTGGTKGKKRIPLTEALGIEDGQPKVYMDVRLGDAEPGRVEFVLFAQFCPRTTENFRALCTGEKGKGRRGVQLHYKGSTFHRVIPGFVCQGGRCTGGQSIYGGYFRDEWTNGYVEHSDAGLLSMANAGRDTNAGGFFITLAPAPHLDGRHVVFGKVTRGMDVVRRVELAARTRQAVIVDCGEVPSRLTQWMDARETSVGSEAVMGEAAGGTLLHRKDGRDT